MDSTPNWVEQRAQNRMQKVFEELRKIVEQDVTEMNAQVEKVRQEENSSAYMEMRVCRFFFTNNFSSQAAVHADPNNYTYQGCIVTFTHDPNTCTIRVESQTAKSTVPGDFEKQQFTVESVQWQEEEQTYLPCIDGKPYPVWEISRRALEPVFFVS